jgi:hypothetical protein
MTGKAHLFAALLTASSLLFIVRLIRRRQLRAKYSFLWLSIGSAMVLLAAWPGLLDKVSASLGVFYPPATLFLAGMFLLFLISVHFSWELSRLEERTRLLAEELALKSISSGSD